MTVTVPFYRQRPIKYVRRLAELACSVVRHVWMRWCEASPASQALLKHQQSLHQLPVCHWIQLSV